MNHYIVSWEIDIQAPSPEEAARKALAIQRDRDSTATCFTVLKVGTREETSIDLLFTMGAGHDPV